MKEIYFKQFENYYSDYMYVCFKFRKFSLFD